MLLTILIAVMVGLLGLVGIARGARRGVIALAGTLLGAVLVDLWQERWSEWLRQQFEPATWPIFLFTGSIFVLVALIVGYGGSILLPRDPKAPPPGLFDRLLGGLVGALNAALISGYLLRYAAEVWVSGEASELILSSGVAGLLSNWLPWFMLALVLTTAIFVVLRGTMRISRALNAKPAVAPAATGAAAQKAPAPNPAPAPAPDPAKSAASDADRRALDKINQALGEKK